MLWEDLGRCRGQNRRGFSVILVPSTGPNPQEGLWQREKGGNHGWMLWCGQGPAGRWDARPPCAGYRDAVSTALPIT